MKLKVIFLFLILPSVLLNCQNLIKNPSFTYVTVENTYPKIHSILPEEESEVSDWYLPKYLDFKLDCDNLNEKYRQTIYYSSRDARAMIENKIYTNGDQLFENNLGFMELFYNSDRPITVIQQKFDNMLPRGRYCFRFKFKFIKYPEGGKAKIDFSFSSDNLQKYYQKSARPFETKMMVPKNLIQTRLYETKRLIEESVPWEQRCAMINLKGDEKYLSIGMLDMSEKFEFCSAAFYIDDLELIKLNDDDKGCPCDSVIKDLRQLYSRNFELNKEISNDTLVMFTPLNNISPRMISPPAKYYLYNLIAFMQRNPSIKIKWIEYNKFSHPNSYISFKRFMTYFGISDDRISATVGPCKDIQGVYCGLKSEYLKIGFILYEN
jgi:hypothetical protein